MNLRRLKYFVKIVDVGSLTQAADILHIAQPALSQQLATLEGEVNQQLLIRTKRGVTPTDAGKTLYCHAQSILRQCELAQSAIDMASASLSGSVSVGLAPGTAAQNLALPLMKEVKQQHPGIVLYLNENVGATVTELIMNGRMDMAVTYDHRSIHGLRVMPLLKEDLYFVCPFSLAKPEKEVSLSQVAQYELFLPRSDNTVRKVLNEAFAQSNLQYRVKCEIESQTTLHAALSASLGTSILPESAARSLLKNGDTWMAKIIEPNVQACLSFCFSDSQPLTQPAEAVKSILLSLMSRRNVENHPLALVG